MQEILKPEKTLVPNMIESPLSAFNNLLLQNSNRLQKIYCNEPNNIIFMNNLIFDNASILIYGCIKLLYVDNKFSVRFIGNFHSDKICLINKTLQNIKELEEIFNNYLYLVNNITNNFDDKISEKYVNDLFNNITDNTFAKNKYHLVPYKNKIKHLYDNNDKVLDKLYNKYTYLIKFNRKSKLTFSFTLVKALSSEFSECKSLENLRFEEIDIILEETLPIQSLKQFLFNFFFYGDIKY